MCKMNGLNIVCYFFILLKCFVLIVLVCVLLHRPGSIIADYQISVTTNIHSSTNGGNSNDFASANLQVSRTLLNAGIPVALKAFSESGMDRI